MTSRMVCIFYKYHAERHENMYAEAKGIEKLLKVILSYFRWWYHECYGVSYVYLLALNYKI